MKRVRIKKAGGYERLELEDVEPPSAKSGEVRVAVEAIGVNFADCIVRMGLYASAKEYVGWPITPGFEVAGRVDEVGEGVTQPRLGDRVIALTRFGGYASSVVVPAHQTFPIPESSAAGGVGGALLQLARAKSPQRSSGRLTSSTRAPRICGAPPSASPRRATTSSSMPTASRRSQRATSISARRGAS